MTDIKTKETILQEIYTPLFENIVVEFSIPEKTKGGIHLNAKDLKELQKETSPIMKVVAIGKKVTDIKVGDYVLPSPIFRPMQVPLIHKDEAKGTQHAQVHISEILGIVDETFAQLTKTKKETTIN